MKKVLEIGCGQGFNCFVLAKDKENRVSGIDISREDIKIASERYPNIDFQVMNAEKMKFTHKIYDEVYALDILEHVNDLEKVIKEVRRILKSNGKFIINVPHPKSEKWLLKIRPTYFKEIHHVRIFNKGDMEKILHKNGFKLIKKQNRGFFQHIELFFLFKRKIDSKSQVSVGSWRDNYRTKLLHALLLFFDPLALHTPLKYIPIWIITIPIGNLINLFGNKLLPKSQYYEFKKP